MAKQFLRFSYNISIDRDDGPSANAGGETLTVKPGTFAHQSQTREGFLAVHRFTAAQAGMASITVADSMQKRYAASGAFYALTDEAGRVLISSETAQHTAVELPDGGHLYWIVCCFEDCAEPTSDLAFSFTGRDQSLVEMCFSKATTAKLHGEGFSLVQANRLDLFDDYSNRIKGGCLDASACGFADENGQIANPVFRAAMLTAAVNNVRLTIPTGTYYLTADADSPYGLDLSFCRLENLHLDGQGSTILMTDNFKGGFCFIGSRHMLVENLVLDYVDVPWAQATVTAIDPEKQTMQLLLDDDYNIFDDPRFHETITAHFGTVRNRENPRLLSADALYYFFMKQCRKLADRVYEVTMLEATPMVGTEILVDDKVLINNRVGCNMSMFDIRRSGDFTLRNITIHTCACTGVVGSQMTGPVTVDDFHMVYRPDSSLWITSTADGVHFQGGPGAVTLTNSSFVGLLDDGMNLYQWRSLVDTVYANDRIRLNTDGGAMPEVGDSMDFFNVPDQKYLGCAEVIAIEDASGEGPHQSATLVLGRPVEGLCGKNDGEKPTYGYLCKHEFAGSVIKNNVFKNLRGRGLVLHTTDTVIENNRFEDISNHGIHGWYGYEEGLRIRNMLIRNNTFERVGYYKREAFQDAAGAISIRLDNSEATVQSLHAFHENLCVRNNTFRDCHGCAVNIGNTNGVEVSGNEIVLDIDHPRYNGEYGIKLSYCDDVLVCKNRMSNAAGDVWTPLAMQEVTDVNAKENEYLAAGKAGEVMEVRGCVSSNA